MIPIEITNDLKAGHGLEETLIKHGTNLRKLFSKQLDNKPWVIEEHTYIRPSGSTTWKICKHIGTQDVHFGVYRTFEEAKIVRDELIACGWDKSQLPGILERTGISRTTKGGARFKCL